MDDSLGDFFDSQAAQQQPAAAKAEPEAPNSKKERKKRTPRQPPADAASPTEKKKRGPKPGGNKKARTAKIEIGAALHALAGLNEDEVAMVIAAANRLSGMPKKSRGRIVAALARMFE